MRWEIPQATDYRFGMEITLYIARRLSRMPEGGRRGPADPSAVRASMCCENQGAGVCCRRRPFRSGIATAVTARASATAPCGAAAAKPNPSLIVSGGDERQWALVNASPDILAQLQANSFPAAGAARPRR